MPATDLPPDFAAADPASPGGALQIGDWALTPATHALRRGPIEHRLPKRLVRLLQVLAEQPGHTFSREQLLERVWDRRLVNDEVLSRAIAELRGLLGDDARAPAYIETLPKTGYRLIAAVSRPRSAPDPGAPDPTTPAPTPPAAPARRPAARWRLGAAVLVALALLAWWQRPGEVAPAVPGSPSLAGAVATSGWSPQRLVHERPFRSGPDWARQPRFSADGRWLSFVLASADDSRTQIMLATADGDAQQVIEFGPGRLSSPVFAPDGTQIAAVAQTESGCQLRIVRLPAGPPQDVADCAPRHGYGIDWPQPGQLIYTAPAADGRGAGLWALDPASGQRQALTDPTAEDIADMLPRGHADGRIAFTRGPFRLQKLWLWQAGAARPLLDSADRITGIVWNRQGDGLLIASDRPGYPALQHLDLVSGQISLLGSRGAATLDRNLDDALLYEQRRYDANIWLYRSTAEPRVLSRSTRYDAYPAISPDQRQVIYVSNRDGNASVWVHRLASGEEQRLDLPTATAWVRPGWLNDQRIVLTRYDGEQPTQVLSYDLPAHRLEPQPLTTDDGFTALPLNDGSLLLGRQHGSAPGMQLQRLLAAGSVDIPGAHAVSEFRSDGRWIVWQQRGQAGLQVFDLEQPDQPPQTLHAPDGLADFQAFTVSEGELVFAAHQQQRWTLWRQPLPAGPASPWLTLRSAPSDPQISVAKQFQFAVVTHIDSVNVDLMWVPPP